MGGAFLLLFASAGTAIPALVLNDSMVAIVIDDTPVDPFDMELEIVLL